LQFKSFKPEPCSNVEIIPFQQKLYYWQYCWIELS